MSVVVTATPMLLFSVLGPLITGAAASGVAYKNIRSRAKELSYMSNASYHLSNTEAENLLNRELKTTIMDKELLIKTLTEHGAEITDIQFDNVECKLENFDMKFTKNIPNEPYSLYIEYRNEEKLNTFVLELDEEYKANAQEASYNKIMENLETKNYTVEQEEITDDNTIVLTVNLE